MAIHDREAQCVLAIPHGVDVRPMIYQESHNLNMSSNGSVGQCQAARNSFDLMVNLRTVVQQPPYNNNCPLTGSFDDRALGGWIVHAWVDVRTEFDQK